MGVALPSVTPSAYGHGVLLGGQRIDGAAQKPGQAAVRAVGTWVNDMYLDQACAGCQVVERRGLFEDVCDVLVGEPVPAPPGNPQTPTPGESASRSPRLSASALQGRPAWDTPWDTDRVPAGR